ncbi:MAG: 16S rRNA (uracil(1498)-N(3))-methyltransferase [Gammaproteobacteria bacterium]|nr:16S rRNA (uracil(1498)-N(3))-methyltransferase [Gammaproteobacteria bacterium]NNC97152.1 16S rRNA (uracil(1498)-N(3))-methyltransferase [Gammaproteobacteria bacterium]NNM13718.1 16S rRNA (uracil(1498)-N(3))-methyltransferase [Gammaproteobacteria bacterium]
MIRLHFSGKLTPNSPVLLDADASHHLARVMRAKVGDHCVVFNSEAEYLATIQSISGKSVEVLIQQQRVNNNESTLAITLLQAVTRRERMDYSIQKATELGVSTIQPVLTQHCVVKLDAGKSEKRIKHWQGIARHATEQSGRLMVPGINPVLPWQAALNAATVLNCDLKMIFALQASRPLSDLQTSIKNSQSPSHICLALGPVGGFSEHEVQLAKDQGFTSIKLGPRILRAETATTAALTAVQMLWGDLN